jgi:hypothetical protein
MIKSYYSMLYLPIIVIFIALFITTNLTCYYKNLPSIELCFTISINNYCT